MATFNSKIVTATKATTKYSKSNDAATIAISGSDIADALLDPDEMKNIGKTTKKYFGLFKKVAPFLGPTFGIISSALNFLPEFSSPGPNDILKSVNKAFEQITKDVNNRLDKMKVYVDHRILTQEKRHTKRTFKDLYLFWTACIKEKTEDDVNRCQRSAARRFYSKQSFFMPGEDKFKKDGKVTDVREVKRIEVGLIVFVQYATMRLLCLQTLINTYVSNGALKHAKSYAKDYMDEFENAVVKSSRYINWAVRQITKSHNCWDGKPYAYEVIRTEDTRPRNVNEPEAWYESNWGKWKKSYSIQTMQCDPVSLESTCTAKGWVYTKTCQCGGNCDKSCSGTFSDVKFAFDKEHASVVVARKRVYNQCKSIHLEKLCKDIKTFWEKEVLSASRNWIILGNLKLS